VGSRLKAFPPPERGNQQERSQQQFQIVARTEPQGILDGQKGTEKIEHAGQLA
jgi:hypothetical protein